MLMNYSYANPTAIEFGAGSIARLPGRIDGLGGGKLLVITDRGVADAGILDQITAVLAGAGVVYEVFDGVQSDPSTEVIEQIHAGAQKAGVNILLAVGGGSPIDAAKGASLLATNDGRLQDYAGVGKVKCKGLPLIAVPTTAGTGSEVTVFAVLSDLAAGLKFTITSELIAPDVAVLDPALTLTLPPRMTAATGLDALTHAIESYTSLISEPLSDALALEAVRIIYRWLPQAVGCGSSLEAREWMMQGQLMAGIAFNNAFLGLSHAIASPLGAYFHVPHGLANAVMLPYVMRYNYRADPVKYGKLAEAMGVPRRGRDLYDKALGAVEAVEKLVDLCGMPKTLREVGASEELLPKVAADALLSVQLKFNCRTASEAQILEVLKTAY